MGKLAVLSAVTVEFSRSHSVGVGDFLSSVNGISTTHLSASDLESVLENNIESFDVIAKSQSKEQMALNRHGFYAKGTFFL